MSAMSAMSAATPALETLSAKLAALRPRMEAMSLAIHAQPELKFAEFHAQKTLTGWLAESGFAVLAPAGGLDTAFVAVHEGILPGPYVAILAEYDALPGIGHGCGHNLIAAGGAAAAIAVVCAWPGHLGTIAVIGTPGEEMGGTGKIRLAGAGIFDGVDHLRTLRDLGLVRVERNDRYVHYGLDLAAVERIGRDVATALQY